MLTGMKSVSGTMAIGAIGTCVNEFGKAQEPKLEPGSKPGPPRNGNAEVNWDMAIADNRTVSRPRRVMGDLKEDALLDL